MLDSAHIAALDQDKASTDVVVSEMVAALRDDLAGGADPTVLWGVLAEGSAGESSLKLAAVMCAALIRLARQ